MPQAQITINTVVGSNDDLAIDTIVALDNNNIGGEVTFLWEILDQPAGPADILSNATIQNPTFTPKKEGTYLIRLTVNESLPDEDIDSVIAAIRQLKTRERVPAAGEQLEDNPSRGWAEDQNTFLRTIDSHIADPGVIVGVNATGGTLARGTVVRVTSRETIKVGLPGEEDLPGFTAAPATSGAGLDELLLVIEQGVDGSDPVSAGALVSGRFIGRIAAITLGGGAIGDSVFVSDTATLALTPGTNARQVGSIMAIDGADRDVWFAGTQAGNAAPADIAYVVYGNPGSLFNAIRVDGLNAGGVINNTPFTVRAGDLTTIPLIAKRFSIAATADLFRIEDEGGSAFVRVESDGATTFTAGVTFSTVTATVGMRAGFAGTPPDDTIDIGDTLFAITNIGGAPRIQFDGSADRIEFIRASSFMNFVVGGVVSTRIFDTGSEIFGGLRVGFQTGVAPPSDVIELGDALFAFTHVSPGAASVPTIFFDANDNFRFTRGDNTFRWDIAASTALTLTATELFVANALRVFADGIVVGSLNAPIPLTVQVGGSNFLLDHQVLNDPALIFDSGGDLITYDRGSDIMIFSADGVATILIQPSAGATTRNEVTIPEGILVFGVTDAGAGAAVGALRRTRTNHLTFRDAQNDTRTLNTIFFPSDADFTPVTNTTAELILNDADVETFPANSVFQGDIIRVRAWGTGSQAANPTATIRIRWGGLTGAIISSMSAAAVNPFNWFIEMVMIVQGAPSAATAVRTSSIRKIPDALTNPPFIAVDQTTIVTNANADLVVTGQFSAANANNSFTLEGFTLEWM